MNINEYKIKDNLTKEELLLQGFTNYNKDYLYYVTPLSKTVSLNISIPIRQQKIDTNETEIEVLDDDFLQPYHPFYMWLETSNSNTFPTLDKIIKNYIKEMDSLVEKGIFIKNEQEKEKPKKRVRK